MEEDLLKSLPPAVQEKWQRLLQVFTHMGSAVVAFSGGVDSGLLCVAAYRALPPGRMLALTANSPVNARDDLQAAAGLAGQFGFPHRVIEHDDLESPLFVANPPDRCYHCKLSRLYAIRTLAAAEGYAWVVEGSNADDKQDYRPGSRAVVELGVRSPLVEVGMTKAEIRQVSHALGMSVWDRPSAPCLATRFPYGSEVTRQGLEQVRQAEAFLLGKGFEPLRVRNLGDTARIEVSPAELVRLMSMHEEVLQSFKTLGFRYVTVDLQGYRTGSMNEVLSK